MDDSAIKIWAKTGKDDSWHPLVLHMLDVAASAEAILAREPEATRDRMASILGLDWREARPWLLFLIASHDTGKASPGFQAKWKDMTGLKPVRNPDSHVNHGFITQLVLSQWLLERGWPDDLARYASDAVGCHHGERAIARDLNDLEWDKSAVGSREWKDLRYRILDSLLTVLAPNTTPAKVTLSGPDFMLLAGLTSFADWIGSNEQWFPFGSSDDCKDPGKWFAHRRKNAEEALDAIGWWPRVPLCRDSKSFQEIFPQFPPRPLQLEVAKAAAGLTEPAILLVEAPMGEGKTEAAWYAHLVMQRQFGHRGLYVALPTKATGNAMFDRILGFLQKQDGNRSLDLQLLHGATLLNDKYQSLRFNNVYDPPCGGSVRAGEWFTHKKRALLSEYGVGTVDQALLPILPVRHNFIRMWGLANRVVIFDEIHAYDAYTGTLLLHLFRWLLALGSSVVLLSATLPPSIRKKMAELVHAKLPENEVDYPRLSVFTSGHVNQTHFSADERRKLAVEVRALDTSLAAVRSTLEEQLAGGGMGLALVNTVQRAQDLYLLFPEGTLLERDGCLLGKRLPDGTEVLLFHARFPADWRQKREEHAVETFGATSHRSGRKILIATQVVEQSLDLDFDVMITDLAPVDLVLQRAGRLWRHKRDGRALDKPILYVTGLKEEEPPCFDQPLWWGAVYHEELLLRTWTLLRGRTGLTLPDDIDPMVRLVYEELPELPEAPQERLAKAEIARNGDNLARKGQADRAVIGYPDDASWNEPERFLLYDEDDPTIHRTLAVQTRLGDQSVMAVPVWAYEAFSPDDVPTLLKAKELSARTISVSRRLVVNQLKRVGVPEGWKKSPLLRNCFPLVLDTDWCWIGDDAVRLDKELGLLFSAKEQK